MSAKQLTRDELQLDAQFFQQVNNWLRRGDGIAVYENQAMDSHAQGHRKFISFGSSAAQIESDDPPQRLPDIGNTINWAYQLVGVYKGAEL